MKIAAEAGVPGIASLDVTAPVMFVREPTARPLLVTLRLKVQLAPEPRLAPPKVMRLPPAGAPMVPPSQVPVSPFGVETSNPAGKVSLNEMPVSDTFELGLVSVNV